MLPRLLLAASLCHSSGATHGGTPPKASALPLPQQPAFPAARPAGPSWERDDIDRSTARQWVVAESDSCVSFNSIDPFSAQAAAQQPGRFHLAVNASGAALAIGSVSARALVLFAPLQWDDLRVAYRAFLHLPAPLQPGVEYTLTATGLNASWNRQPLARAVRFDAGALSANIRLNQVGFLPQQRPKRAWLGQYAGQAADGRNTPVRFFSHRRAASFEVVDALTDRVALSGEA